MKQDRLERRIWLGAALAIVTVVALVDLSIGEDIVLIALVIVGPLVASMTVSSRATALVGAYALGWAIINGLGPDHLGQKQEMTRIITILAASILAVYAARQREEREVALHEIAKVADVAQQAILRRPPPRLGPIAIAARYRSAAAAASIGGDFYETALTFGGARLVLGDVRGKGLDAVRLAASVLGAFRESVFSEGGLPSLVKAVDCGISHELGDEDFVTAVFVDAPFGTGISVVNCGHHPPLLITADAEQLLSPLEPSPPLGMHPCVTIDSFPMQVGDRVLLYTDGLVEARNETGGHFALTDHAGLLRDGSLDTALGALVDRLLDHVGGRLDDDLALMLIERMPE